MKTLNDYATSSTEENKIDYSAMLNEINNLRDALEVIRDIAYSAYKESHWTDVIETAKSALGEK